MKNKNLAIFLSLVMIITLFSVAAFASEISVVQADGPVLTGVSIDDDSNTVLGMTSVMEFSINGTDWKAYNEVTPNLPDLTSTVALQVRIAATTTHEAGAIEIFNFTVALVLTSPVNLGTAGDYAILAKTGISSVPNSVITGNIGVSPIDSTAITGFSLTNDATNEFSGSTQVTGKVYAADYASPTPSNLTTSISNMETAYTDAAGRAADYTELYTGDLSGQTLTAGVYKWGTGVLITSDVTLHGGANDVWIFQVAKGITQEAGTKIILSGGAQAKNIFWQVAQTVSIGTGSHFEGIVLAKTNIALGTNASINGRLLAQTAVTLIMNTVVAPSGEPTVTIADVSNLIELKAAIENIEIETINITENIADIAEALIVNHEVTINGDNHTLTFTDALNTLENGNRQGILVMSNGTIINNLVVEMAGTIGWQGVYGIQIYNATGVVINNYVGTGADAALLINASSVQLKGITTVTGNEFGGIEVSKGIAAGLPNSELTVMETLVNGTEAYGKPTIWLVNGQGTVTSGPLIINTIIEPTQTQYYLNAFAGV